MNVPIIRLEVEGMKQIMLVALQRESAKLDSAIQQAIEAFCTEGNVNRIVASEAQRQIDEAVRQEVKHFFDWSGNGRKAIREAVTEYLNERYPSTD